MSHFNGLKHLLEKQIHPTTPPFQKILHVVGLVALSVGVVACHGEPEKTTVSGTVSTNVAASEVPVTLNTNEGRTLSHGCKTDEKGNFKCEVRRLDVTPLMRLQSEGEDPMDSLIVKQKIPTDKIIRHINPITNFIAQPTNPSNSSRETSQHRSGREDSVRTSRSAEEIEAAYEQKVQSVSDGLGVKAEVFINNPSFEPRVKGDLNSGSVAANLLEAIGKSQKKAGSNQGSNLSLNEVIGNVLETATQKERPVVTQPEILVRLAAISLTRNQAEAADVAKSFSQILTTQKVALATTEVFLGVAQAFGEIKKTANETVQENKNISPKQQSELLQVALQGVEGALVNSLETKTSRIKTSQLKNLATNMVELLKEPVSQAIVEANDEFQGFDRPMEVVEKVVVSAAIKVAEKAKENNMDLTQTQPPSLQEKKLLQDTFKESQTEVQTKIIEKGPQVSQKELDGIAKIATLPDYPNRVCPFNANGQPVIVKDTNGKDLYPSQIQEIDCSNGGASLAGTTTPLLAGTLSLNAYVNARILNLSDNRLTALRDLNQLTKLTTLNLQNNQLTNIGKLNGLTKLTTLELQNNQLNDIGNLSQLTQLTTLKLGGSGNTMICDSLGTPPNLASSGCLEAYTNPVCPWGKKLPKIIRDSKGNPVIPARITNIQCEKQNLSGILSVSQYVNLTTLNLSDNQLQSIGDLSGLTKLTNLNLSYNQLQSIDGLSGLTELTQLNLVDNELQSIGDLSGLTKLTNLNLGNNQLQSIGDLSGLTELTTLELSDNQLQSIGDLSGLTKLTMLDLSINRLQSIGDLSGLTKLTQLYLGGNRLQSIGDLSGLTKLIILYLGGTKISCSDLGTPPAGKATLFQKSGCKN